MNMARYLLVPASQMEVIPSLIGYIWVSLVGSVEKWRLSNLKMSCRALGIFQMKQLIWDNLEVKLMKVMISCSPKLTFWTVLIMCQGSFCQQLSLIDGHLWVCANNVTVLFFFLFFFTNNFYMHSPHDLELLPCLTRISNIVKVQYM